MFEDWLCGYSEIVGENRKILTFQERCKRLMKLSFNTIREFIIPGHMHFADLFNPVQLVTMMNNKTWNTMFDSWSHSVVYCSLLLSIISLLSNVVNCQGTRSSHNNKENWNKTFSVLLIATNVKRKLLQKFLLCFAITLSTGNSR